MSGFDPKDSTSLDLPVPNWEGGAVHGDLRGKRVGIPQGNIASTACRRRSNAVAAGHRCTKDAGVRSWRCRCPHTHQALATYYIIAPAEASSNLARYDGVRCSLRELPLDFRPEARRARSRHTFRQGWPPAAVRAGPAAADQRKIHLT